MSAVKWSQIRFDKVLDGVTIDDYFSMPATCGRSSQVRKLSDLSKRIFAPCNKQYNNQFPQHNTHVISYSTEINLAEALITPPRTSDSMHTSVVKPYQSPTFPCPQTIVHLVPILFSILRPLNELFFPFFDNEDLLICPSFLSLLPRLSPTFHPPSPVLRLFCLGPLSQELAYFLALLLNHTLTYRFTLPYLSSPSPLLLPSSFPPLFTHSPPSSFSPAFASTLPSLLFQTRFPPFFILSTIINVSFFTESWYTEKIAFLQTSSWRHRTQGLLL